MHERFSKIRRPSLFIGLYSRWIFSLMRALPSIDKNFAKLESYGLLWPFISLLLGRWESTKFSLVVNCTSLQTSKNVAQHLTNHHFLKKFLPLDASLSPNCVIFGPNQIGCFFSTAWYFNWLLERVDVLEPEPKTGWGYITEVKAWIENLEQGPCWGFVLKNINWKERKN